MVQFIVVNRQTSSACPTNPIHYTALYERIVSDVISKKNMLYEASLALLKRFLATSGNCSRVLISDEFTEPRFEERSDGDAFEPRQTCASVIFSERAC